MMKSCSMALLLMISFLLVVGRSSGRLLMKNTILNSPDNPLAFDPSLNSRVEDESTLHTADGHMEKNAVDCHQERSSSAKSATTENKKSFKLSPSVQKTQKIQSSALNKAEGVFNLIQKGTVTPSGSSPKVNSMVTEQRLSTSGKSPGVGHMKMIRPKSQTINVIIPNSHHSHGDDHLQQEKSNKRKLGSTPSPGGGSKLRVLD